MILFDLFPICIYCNIIWNIPPILSNQLNSWVPDSENINPILFLSIFKLLFISNNIDSDFVEVDCYDNEES
jgi:hypothetical protein